MDNERLSKAENADIKQKISICAKHTEIIDNTNYVRNFESYILEYLTLSILLKSNSFFLRRLACAGFTK